MFHNRVEIHNNFYGARFNSFCCRPINPFCCNSFNVFDFYRFNNNYSCGSLGLNPFTINPLGINPFTVNPFSFNTFALNFNSFNPFSLTGYNNPVFNYGNQFGMLNNYGFGFNQNTFSSFQMTYPSFNFDYNSVTNSSGLQETSSPETETATSSKVKQQTPANAQKLGKPFLDKVKQVAKNVNCDYRDLLALMNSESSLNPKAGKGTSYVGLVQFGSAAIEELNTKGGYKNLTKEKILNMSAIEQLDLVEKLIKICKKYAKFSDNEKLSAGDLYALIFAPGRAGREVLYSQGESGYNSVNAKMDYNKDGKITKSELAQRLDKKRVNESVFA